VAVNLDSYSGHSVVHRFDPYNPPAIPYLRLPKGNALYWNLGYKLKIRT
jgi:hypothetical protein